MAFESGITMLIHNKDDIEFVTEFPCFLGHPVSSKTFLSRLATVMFHVDFFRLHKF